MRNNRRIWRGFTTVTASLLAFSIGAGAVCERWKENIDQNIGTTSSIIETADKTKEGTYTYLSDYTSTDDLIQRHLELNELLSEEGSVLLKNEQQALPLAQGASVTLFGSNSHYPYYGGQMGGSVEESQAVSLETALTERGFTVNPVMTELYETMGNIVTGTTQDGKDIYGYQPGDIAVNLFTGVATEGYRVGEPPLSVYEENDPDYADSFEQYSDAAIVVIGRTGTEGGDYQPGKEGLAEGESGTTALALNEEEKDMISLACDNFDKVIVLVNTISQMEIEELRQNDEIDAILWVGFPGCYGFYGVADILNGTSNPSGHLADTYAVNSLSAPSMQNYGYIEYANGRGGAFNTYIVEAEGIYIGYKYYETRYADAVMKQGNADSNAGSSTDKGWNYKNEVSYGFGYGLSYTEFEQTLDSVILNEDKTVTVTATIKNIGDTAGKDVAQIYVQTPYTDYDKENLVEKSAVQLIDYMKSDILQPGESQTLTTTFDMKYMASYDYTKAKTYIMDAGDYYLALGNGAHDALNNILAAQGYSVKDGMDYAGKEDLVFTWNQKELDTTSFAVAENGSKITNQLDDADLNYWQPDTVTYLSRQDWEKTWTKRYENIEITEEMDEYLTKKNGFYYIMCAEGGTGYNHCVTMGRAENVWGPYERDPQGAIVTSVPAESDEREDWEHLKTRYFNPDTILQKSGHGSYIETPKGEVYLLHLCARPFVPELRCPLGRETAIQKMKWTADGWLRMADGSKLAKEYVEESGLREYLLHQIPSFDDFDGDKLGNWYYAPRISPESFADVTARPGYVRIRGQESRTSLNRVSILARKLTSVHARITTKMEFVPEIYQHSAGLILYYDNMNYVNLRKYYSQTLGQSALSIVHLENGERNELRETRIAIGDMPVYLRLTIEGRRFWFSFSLNNENYVRIGPDFDTTRFSDEYCQYGEFTGTFVGMTCADRMFHRQYADFDFFEYLADEDARIE